MPLRMGGSREDPLQGTLFMEAPGVKHPREEPKGGWGGGGGIGGAAILHEVPDKGPQLAAAQLTSSATGLVEVGGPSPGAINGCRVAARVRDGLPKLHPCPC